MGNRRRQVVSSKNERLQVILWMTWKVVQQGSEEQTAAQAIDDHPNIFINRTNCPKLRRAHREKARDWWKKRETFIQQLEGETTLIYGYQVEM